MSRLASWSNQKTFKRHRTGSTKTLFKITVPFHFIAHSDALRISGFDRLDYRRDIITQKLFREIKNPKHPLHDISPPVKVIHSQNGPPP